MKINITFQKHFSLFLLSLILIIFFNQLLYVNIIILGTLFFIGLHFKNKMILIIVLISTLFFLKFKYEYNYREKILNTYSEYKENQFFGKIVYLHNNSLKVRLGNGFNLFIFCPNKHFLKNLHLNDQIKIQGKFYPVAKPTNPGQINDYKYSLHHKILGRLKIQKLDLIKKNNNFSLPHISYWIKHQIIRQHNTCLQQPYSNILTALIFGDAYTNLESNIKDLFQKSGIIHALVVSGSQVSLVLSLLVCLLSFLNIYRKYQFALIIPICIIFYFITGGGISVLRSIIMALTFLFIKYFLNYRTSTFNILVFTALIIIFIDPFSPFKLGAILSFVTTFSLLWGPHYFVKLYPNYVPTFIRNTISLSLLPWLFSTPILMIYFNKIYPLSFFTNLALIFLIEVLVVVGFISTLIGFASISLASILHQFNWLIMKYIILTSNFSLQFHQINFSVKYPIISLLLIFFIVSIYKYLNKYWLKKYFIFIYVLLFYCLNFIHLKNTVYIDFLDVGQGDSALIRYKNKSILVDTGPRYDKSINIEKKILFPILNYYGINSIDYLIITHFDSDHDSNLIPLLKNISVKNFIYSGEETNLKSNVLNYLLKQKTNYYSLCRKHSLKLDDLSLQFLNSCNQKKYPSKNNNSLVFSLLFNSHNILFTGDIEKEAESELSVIYKHLLKTTLLKVAHHGSRTSSSDLFLNFTKPLFSIVSSGRNNRYNHPNDTVLDKLNRISKVFQTSKNGALSVEIGNSIKFNTFLSNH